MKHHRHYPDFPFVEPPEEFDKNTEKGILQYCLGGTLYMPGTREIGDKLLQNKMTDLTSMVMCFEDAIDASQLPQAEENVLNLLGCLAEAIDSGNLSIADLPLIFLRVRNSDQFRSFTARLTKKNSMPLSGFVFPKFYSNNAVAYLETLAELNSRLDTVHYGMPILEGSSIAYLESRTEELLKLHSLLQPFQSQILNIRVGGTDFSSLFGVRRDINSSIYDILPVRDCLSEILNIFNRVESDYVVSGAVWEYFLADKRDDIEGLLNEKLHRSLLNRSPILNDAVDGLLREITLDKANGFIGKTVIHPSHLKFVNAMQAVTREEYDDALQILNCSGGVVKSSRSNKMNEINPHRNWARRIKSRALAYGVIEDENAYLRLMLH